MNCFNSKNIPQYIECYTLAFFAMCHYLQNEKCEQKFCNF